MRCKRRWKLASHASCRAYSEMRGWRGTWTWVVCGGCNCGYFIFRIFHFWLLALLECECTFDVILLIWRHHAMYWRRYVPFWRPLCLYMLVGSFTLVVFIILAAVYSFWRFFVHFGGNPPFGGGFVYFGGRYINREPMTTSLVDKCNWQGEKKCHWRSLNY